jgi:hypothetical protein
MPGSRKGLLLLKAASKLGMTYLYVKEQPRQFSLESNVKTRRGLRTS